MSKHRIIQLLSGLLILILFVLHQNKTISFYTFWICILLVLIVYITIQVIASYFLQLQYYLPAIIRGNKGAKSLCLTFDDGPHANTSMVLDVLKKHNATATFFLIGKNIDGNETIIKRIMDEGHTIGNHSFEHNFWYSIKSEKALIEDINKNNAIIKKHIDKDITWYRPPYGVSNPNIANAVAACNMQVIGWSIRSYDTTGNDVHKTFQRVVNQFKHDDIVLLHDHLDTTAQLLELILSYCKKEEISIIPLQTIIESIKK